MGKGVIIYVYYEAASVARARSYRTLCDLSCGDLGLVPRFGRGQRLRSSCRVVWLGAAYHGIHLRLVGSTAESHDPAGCDTDQSESDESEDHPDHDGAHCGFTALLTRSAGVERLGGRGRGASVRLGAGAAHRRVALSTDAAVNSSVARLALAGSSSWDAIALAERATEP